MKNIMFVMSVVLSFIFTSCATQKNAGDIAALQQSLLHQNFTFEAQQVVPRDYRISQILPNSSQLYHLSPGYVVKVRRDSLIVDLPFFGRAYQAPMDPSKGGIKMTSTDFTILRNKSRKNLTELIITPKDNNEVQQMFLSVSENGYGTLNVIQYQKESINFYGVVIPK